MVLDYKGGDFILQLNGRGNSYEITFLFFIQS